LPFPPTGDNLVGPSIDSLDFCLNLLVTRRTQSLPILVTNQLRVQ
jgi:hypothetical protein